MAQSVQISRVFVGHNRQSAYYGLCLAGWNGYAPTGVGQNPRRNVALKMNPEKWWDCLFYAVDNVPPIAAVYPILLRPVPAKVPKTGTKKEKTWVMLFA